MLESLLFVCCDSGVESMGLDSLPRREGECRGFGFSCVCISLCCLWFILTDNGVRFAFVCCGYGEEALGVDSLSVREGEY